MPVYPGKQECRTAYLAAEQGEQQELKTAGTVVLESERLSQEDRHPGLSSQPCCQLPARGEANQQNAVAQFPTSTTGSYLPFSHSHSVSSVTAEGSAAALLLTQNPPAPASLKRGQGIYISGWRDHHLKTVRNVCAMK